MRSIGLLILITVAFTWAADTTPPPTVPHIMLITTRTGTDSILCSRLDPEVGVTFIDNNMKMKVGILDPDEPFNPDVPVYIKSNRWYSTSQIISITFAPVAAPASAMIKRKLPAAK